MTKGWDALHTAVAEARALIAAHAPDDAVREEGEAYVARVLAASLGTAVLGHLLREDGLARPLPCYGGPNPDYVMRHAAIAPAGCYRLTGRLNRSERVGIGLYRPDPAGGTPIEVGYAAFDRHNCAAGGAFALDLFAGADTPGSLSIPADARILLIRILHRAADRDHAQIRLEGAAATQGLALATGTSEGAVAAVASQLVSSVRTYLRWTEAVRAHPNRFERAPPELATKVQGDPDTQYFLGSFDLGEQEHLEVTLPAEIAGYWSVHVYNLWFEHLQVPGIHDSNARRENGAFKISVGPMTPDVANRIDTLGRRRGALICRVIGAPPLEPPAAALRRSGPAGPS